jgi:hypothetical protein
MDKYEVVSIEEPNLGCMRYSYRMDKEIKVVGFDIRTSEFVTVVTCQIQQARNYGPIYCNLWINTNGRGLAQYKTVFGSGRAGGSGYDKDSAAVSNAAHAAGIRLNRSLGGTGLHAQALLAIAKHCWPNIPIAIV